MAREIHGARCSQILAVKILVRSDLAAFMGLPRELRTRHNTLPI
jgi:hypothetical protein